MQKVKWIIGLGLTGMLAVSGATYAFTTGSVKSTAQALYPSVAVATPHPAINNTAPVTTAFYSTDNSNVSANSQTPETKGYNSGAGNGYGGYGYGMMGGNGNYGSGYGMMSGSTSSGWGCGGYNGAGNTQNSTDNASVQKDTEASLQNAQVDKTNNSISYIGQSVKIVMLGGPEQADGKFVVAGLVNPTLHIPQGATVTIEFINADAGMPHAFEITNAAPPYDYMSMMDGSVYPGSFISPLPEAQKDQFPVLQTTFKAEQSGNYYYICQYPGHAAKGMYGKLVIK